MKARIKFIPRRKKKKRAGREDARRFASKVSTGLLVIGVVVGLVMIANRWAKKEEIGGVRIVGRSILDSVEIMERAAIPDTVQFQKLELEAIERRVAEHPFISRASVYRGENGTVVIDIAERVPVAIALLGGAPVYLDSLGVMLPYRFSSAGFDLPVLGGVTVQSPASSGAQSNGGIVVDSARVREALGVLATLKEYDDELYRQVSEVRREPWGEYTLITTDGAVPVQAGYPADLAGRLRKLDLFLTTVLAARGPRQASSVDLRWKGQVVVRWRPERPDSET